MGGAVSSIFGGGAPTVQMPAAKQAPVESSPAAKATSSATDTNDKTTGGGKAALKKKSAYALSMQEQGDQTKKPLYRGSLYGQSKLSS